ncbi:DUF1992 domain-containing protein [Lapillicoccus jejuensis]|uniref:Uncharacterized protein DUF1992 n=1 Tax=Lapillicoccus jejuensis TaxID=402171 RepID=A0A542DVW3_9MICO|nr:DUF1992 domain-containing protein [Lapillicoccus jejuensis]TQJ07175.1 uncharacterized protein DUF1992 [Lapillicoccus jejuensis]
MSQSYGETWVERQIREAQERGEFDDLPGAGKPLTGLGDPHSPHDPDWWVRAYAEREHLDLSAALPAPLALRREAAGFPESLRDVSREADAREVLEDFNRRVREDRLRPATGPLPPLLAPTVDVEEVLARWRALRAEDARRRTEASPAADAGASAAPPAPPRRWRWWARRRAPRA